VKTLNYMAEGIFVARTGSQGRGVFTSVDLKKNTLIETASVIVMPPKDRLLLDQTLLHDYIFEWGETEKQCCMALGCVPLYNHSYQSNCEYEMDFRQQLIHVRTVRAVPAGEQLFINYNGDWNNKQPVWFDAE
jgi:SET domain-containing protein